MKNIGGVASVAALSVIALSACSATASPTVTVTVTNYVPVPLPNPSPTGTPPEARNPVELLKRVPGCVIPEGTEVGVFSGGGSRSASCDFMDNDGGSRGTTLQIMTLAGEKPGSQIRSDDSHRKIVGDDFVATLTGRWNAYAKWLTVEKIESIASILGGKYILPG